MAMHTASWFPEIGSDADPYMDPTFRKAWVESARRRGIEGQGIMDPRAYPVVESLKFRYGAWLDGMLGWEAGKLPGPAGGRDGVPVGPGPAPEALVYPRCPDRIEKTSLPPPLVGIIREFIRLHHQDRHGLKPAAGACASNR